MKTGSGFSLHKKCGFFFSDQSERLESESSKSVNTEICKNNTARTCEVFLPIWNKNVLIFFSEQI